METSTRERIWPAWGPRRGYAQLAKFVSTEALVGTGLEEAPAAPRASLAPQDAERELAAACFRRLQGRELVYALDPWVPPRSQIQQIRHPEWLLSARCATCLDLTVTYAAMCLEHRMAPLIAVGHGHAWVGLRLGAASDPDWLDGRVGPPGSPTREPGVGRIEDSYSSADDTALLFVDVVAATEPESGFDAAVERGHALLRRGIRLVDVAWLFTQEDFGPYPPPTRRPGIRTFVPGGALEFKVYDSRPAPSALLPPEGTVVMRGDQGTGKSTLARALAIDAPHGAAWFLDASSRQSLVDSLARAELAERNLRGHQLTDVGREGYAFAALERLRDAPDDWLIVLDNADGPPSQIRSLIPQPNGRQRVVITTTNPLWDAVFPTVPLKRLEPEEVERCLGGPELVPLVAGRPLVLEAFLAYRAATGADVAATPAHGPEVDDTLGPDALWRAIETTEATSPKELRLCALAAQLPPDSLPVALLARLSSLDDGAVEQLATCGLFIWDGDSPRVRLHRLFAERIRTALGSRGVVEAAALTIAQDAEALALLDKLGDTQTMQQLAARLAAADEAAVEPDRECGDALHGLAWVLELKGDTRGSALLYARAERHLLGDDPDTIVKRADCLHGRARKVNQQDPEDEPLVNAAIEWAQRARELLRSAGLDAQTGRPMAMEALLVQKTADFTSDRALKLERLSRANALLEEADALRRVALDERDPERARSTFNLAGIRIKLAQADRQQAATHLKRAEEVYEEVNRFRRELYGRIHPHIAACENGLALVGYYRATLLEASAVERTVWLRAATQHAEDALNQREALDGTEDLTDTGKTARLLAKILTTRWSLPHQPDDTVRALHDEVFGELSDGRIILRSVPRLTSDVDPTKHIETWVRSDALAAIVEWFGGRPPTRQALVAEALGDLDAFSDVWDYRGQRAERNQVNAPTFSGYDEAAVLAAARALGLDDKAGPPRREYDHVIVLGGLARACLSRPLAAAKLVNDGKVTTRNVVALGGFRELNQGEHRFLDGIGISGPVTELDVMDLGMRRAFGIEDDAEIESEDVVEEHRRWERRKYPNPRLALLVVAAPAPSAERRATTGETLRWLAETAGLLVSCQSVLLITTHHYRCYQLADALRELAPLKLTIDAVGISPGELDHRLAYRPATHEYLQEIRSTIRAYRQLHAAVELAHATA